MRNGLVLALVVSCLCAPHVAVAQSWNSRSSAGVLDVSWALSGSEYSFTVYNPVNSGVVAWTLEPFGINLAESTISPKGWRWNGSGGWNQFELADNADKYTVGGPAIEPGESVVFVYTLGSSSQLVNRGGPGGGEPMFLAHVGAVGGQSDGRWLERITSLGKTWYDAPNPPEWIVIPEPPSWQAFFLGIFSLGCLRAKRARV